MSLRTNFLVILAALALASCGEDAVQTMTLPTEPGAVDEPEEVTVVRLKIGGGGTGVKGLRPPRHVLKTGTGGRATIVAE